LDLSTNFKIRSLLIFNHILGLYAVYTAFSFDLLLLSYLIGFIFGGIGISIGYHRYYAHRGFELNKVAEVITLFIGTLCSVGSAITWVGIHREHHANSDTDKDPHSPKYNGKLRTLFHVWSRYDIKPMFVKSLLSNNLLKLQHKHYFIILLLFISFLIISLGPVWTAYLYSIPAVYVFYATGIVNSINHWKGKPNNIPLLNLITSGESYHLNHHNNTKSWRFGKYDPMAPIIWLLKKDRI
jgi:stearoyl-CoA desaturase (delta-9 desaturase)